MSKFAPVKNEFNKKLFSVYPKAVSNKTTTNDFYIINTEQIIITISSSMDTVGISTKMKFIYNHKNIQRIFVVSYSHTSVLFSTWFYTNPTERNFC